MQNSLDNDHMLYTEASDLGQQCCECPFKGH